MDRLSEHKKEEREKFIQAIKSRKGPLSAFFKTWALETGKASGSVRNAYYAIAKKSREDKDFCEKYFDGKPLEVSKIVCFSKDEEKNLIDAILKGKEEGKSVRSVILSLSGGDVKKALRLQNKYRNYVTERASRIVNAVPTGIEQNESATQFVKSIISEKEFSLVKKSIDDVVRGITLSAKRENEILKEKIYALQLENLKLKSRLPQNPTKRFALDFFFGGDEDGVN